MGANFATHAVFPTVVCAPQTSKLYYLLPAVIFNRTDKTDQNDQTDAQNISGAIPEAGGGDIVARGISKKGYEGGVKGLKNISALLVRKFPKKRVGRPRYLKKSKGWYI